MRIHQHHSMRGNTLFAAHPPHILGGGGLDVHTIKRNTEIGGNEDAHVIDICTESGRLSNNRYVGIFCNQITIAQRNNHATQQNSTVNVLISTIGIGKVAPDITQRGCTEQRIAQGMQDNVTVRVRDQTACVRNPDTTKHKRAFATKAMRIEAVSDSHIEDPGQSKEPINEGAEAPCQQGARRENTLESSTNQPHSWRKRNCSRQSSAFPPPMPVNAAATE
jgi:hypothetical protein